MTDLFHRLSSLSPEHWLQSAAGSLIVMLLGVMGWKLTRLAGRGAVWLFRKAPPSPLCAAIVEALDAPDAHAPGGNIVEAGGVRVVCVGTTFDINPALEHVQTRGSDEEIKDTLTPHERQRISRKAHATYRRVKAREDAERAAVALARIPAPYWPRG